jgi:hypothetical protein
MLLSLAGTGPGFDIQHCLLPPIKKKRKILRLLKIGLGI